MNTGKYEERHKNATKMTVLSMTPHITKSFPIAPSAGSHPQL